MENLEELFYKKLVDSGIPREKIVYSYRLGKNYCIDFAVMDESGKYPVAIYDLISGKSQIVRENKINRISKYVSVLPIQPKAFLVCVDENKNFSFQPINITCEEFSKEEKWDSNISSYEMLTQGFDKKVDNKRNEDKKSIINGLKIICWGFIPILIILTIVLTTLGLIELTNQILILIGCLFGSLIVPFLKEISIGDYGVKLKSDKKNEE